MAGTISNSLHEMSCVQVLSPQGTSRALVSRAQHGSSHARGPARRALVLALRRLGWVCLAGGGKGKSHTLLFLCAMAPKSPEEEGHACPLPEEPRPFAYRFAIVCSFSRLLQCAQSCSGAGTRRTLQRLATRCAFAYLALRFQLIVPCATLGSEWSFLGCP